MLFTNSKDSLAKIKDNWSVGLTNSVRDNLSLMNPSKSEFRYKSNHPILNNNAFLLITSLLFITASFSSIIYFKSFQIVKLICFFLQAYMLTS